MTGDRLRAAAAKLREVAEGASVGPWTAASEGPYVRVGNGYEYAADATASREPVGDATFIATLDPPVALALADLLDEVTGFAERYQTGSMARRALAVADAVLAGVDEQVGA